MTLEIFTALATFAFVTVITPGPNNLMLMASGANFGMRRSLPHMLGIILGFPMMILLVGMGVMRAFELWPMLRQVLLVASVAYMGWLSWKIAHAAPPTDAPANARPLTFLQSAGFQWINPKAWTMAVGAITLYAASRDMQAIVWVAGMYVAVALVSTTVWVSIGQQVRRVLRNPAHLRAFNWVMAGLLLTSLVPALLAG